MNFTPFPFLETDRLMLRDLQMTDDEDIFLHRSDDLVNKYLEGFRHADIAQTREFIRKIQNAVSGNESIYWVITLKDTHRFIGTICVWNISKEENKAETGYTLLPGFHGQGYMHEALEAVLAFGFDVMKLGSMEAYTHRDNGASIKVLLHSKFKQDTIREVTDGSPEIVFTLARDAYNHEKSRL